MERQSRLPIDSLVKALLVTAGAWALKELAFSAATKDVVLAVRERAAGACETCKRETPESYSTVSHRDHNKKNGHYQNPDRLVYNCKRCEAQLHLTHFNTPGLLGLDKQKNAEAAYANICQLNDEDYSWIIEHYSKPFATLIRYLQPKE